MLKKLWICMQNQSKCVLFFLIILSLMPRNSWCLFEKVSTGITAINISKNVYLKIESPFPKGCFDSVGLISRENCFPQNKLYLIANGKKNDFTHIVSKWEDVFVYFVQLSPAGYFADLDKDGSVEFAIYPMLAGNNVVTDAYIYSVIKDNLIYYGRGRFNSESGKYVIDILKSPPSFSNKELP